MAYVTYHDTTYNPVGLWNLNGALTDSSGNGFTLGVETGTERYTDIFPGLRGFNFDGSTRLVNSSLASVLSLAGDMTIEMIVVPRARVSATYVSHSYTSNASSTDNTQYSVGFDSTVNGGSLFWRSQHGTVVTDTYAVGNNMSPLSLNHLAVTRTSNVIQFYLNGQTLGSASSALTAPTGGANTTFKLGSGISGFTTVPAGILASVKVCSFALSANQIRGEFNQTLGNFFGVL